jgi:hypothetical protein
MKKEFVPYELALRMKLLGFKEKTLHAYYKDTGHLMNIGNGHEQDTPAPTWQSAFRWFREEYNIFPEILTDCTTEPKFCYTYTRFFSNSKDLASEEWGWENNIGQYSLLYRTYEEAELECLKNLCDILEQQLKDLD